MDDLEVRKAAIKYEKERGSVALIKQAFSALTKVLVEKGCFTEEELRNKFGDLLQIEEQWNELDSAARANLTDSQVAEYERYKQDLKQGGTEVKEGLKILSGFIWDESEELPG